MRAVVLLAFLAVSLPAFAMSYALRSGGDGAFDRTRSRRLVGKAMLGIGGIILVTGIALALAPDAMLRPIAVAFVIGVNVIVMVVVVGTLRRQRKPRER